MRNQKRDKFLLILIISFLLGSCYEPISKCLDIKATNYDVSADEPCDDCCSYPKLTLNIDHVMEDTLDFEEDSIYYTRFDQPYSLKNIQYYISSIQLLRDDQRYQSIEDSILFTDSDGNDQTRKDDFIYLTTNTSSYSIGTFIEPGSYEKIKFFIGLEDAVNRGDLSSLSSNHPLISSRDSMYIDDTNGYNFYRMTLSLDPLGSPIIEDLIFFGDSNLITVELDLELVILNGKNVSINIDVDYSKWFKLQDLSLDIETIKENTEEMIGSGFSIEQ